jgi:four helix bundle protein
MIIYKLSQKWPLNERYSLTDQIRRASRSVCSNIAEAWRKRRYPAHFISKLSDADSEAAETEVWLYFASNCGYLEKIHFETLKDNYDHICRMLTKMMSNANSWKLSN